MAKKTRSAATGRYVSREEAKANPSTTVVETDEAARLRASVTRLERTLRLAAGYISAFEPHQDQHPEDVLAWLFKEADAVRNDD